MSKGKTVTQSKTTVPEYQKQAFQDLYRAGRQAYNQPFQAYTGQMVADQSPLSIQAQNAASNQLSQIQGMNLPGMIQNQMNQGAPQVNQVDFTPQLTPFDRFTGVQGNRGDIREVTAGDVTNEIGRFMNPYMANVIDQGTAAIDRARTKRLAQDQDEAIGRGAFGGSRGTLLEAETNRNFDEKLNEFVGTQMQQGFDTALNAATAEQSRMMDADRLNQQADQTMAMQNLANLQQAGITGQGIDADMSKFLADQQFNAANLQQQANLANANLLADNQQLDRGLLNDLIGFNQSALGTASQQGMLDQNYEQQLLDAQRGEFDRRTGYADSRLNALVSAVSGVPSLASTSQSQQKKTGVGDILGAGLQIAGLFSDARLKEDIQPIGVVNGHNLYTWKWNNEAIALGADQQPNYGVIAQEVAHIDGAVFEDESGYLKVNYEVLQ